MRERNVQVYWINNFQMVSDILIKLQDGIKNVPFNIIPTIYDLMGSLHERKPPDLRLRNASKQPPRDGYFICGLHKQSLN